MARHILPFVALLAAACSTPSAPSPTPSAPAVHVSEIDYDINVPSVSLMQQLRMSYPDGIKIAPMTAQRLWDYTSTYGGSPNVYYGAVAPQCPMYFHTGIVIAPVSAASVDQFTRTEWPGFGEPGITYQWVGRFVYAIVPTPDQYTFSAACVQP